MNLRPHEIARERALWIGAVEKVFDRHHLVMRVARYLKGLFWARSIAAYPSNGAIARAVGSHTTHVAQALKKLKQAGFIEVKGSRNPGRKF